MEPDRFDDVEYRILESPEPPPRLPRRPRRWALALGATLLAAGALAAGASALTDSDSAAPAAKPRLSQRAEDSLGFARRGHDCHRGEGQRAPDASFGSSSRY